MIRYINPQELIKTEQFVREPVDTINKDIIEDTSKKIILIGGRSSGKSVVLQSMQDRGLGTNNQTIFMRFDSAVNFSTKPSELFDDAFFNHYYELTFSWKLLTYIKEHYFLTYEAYFKDIEELLKSISENTDYFINNISYDTASLKRYLTPTEISAEILTRIKKYLGIDSLSLVIDRFDWTNGRSEYTQQILSRYFDLFDKSVITSDDPSLEEDDIKEKLENKGFSIKTATYGKDENIVKQIIRKRIKLYNETLNDSNKFFDENIMTNKIYTKLVNGANGNISILLDTFEEVSNLLLWNSDYVKDLESKFDDELNNQLSKVKRLREMDAHPPKFYL